MLGSVSTSRRANAFAEALDEPRLDGAPAERTPAAPAEPTPAGPSPAARAQRPPGPAADAADQGALLSVADELRSLPRPELSAETKTVHRAQLLAAMENAFGGGGERVPEQRAAGAHRAPVAGALSRLRPKSRLTKGLAAGGLTLGVAAGAFGGAAAASTNALPGDTLYGLKRGMEDLRLDLAGSSADRGKIYLDRASTRLNEARRLMEREKAGDLDPEQLAEVRSTLSTMHSDASEGHRLLSEAYESDGAIGPLRTLSDFSEKSMTTWSDLRYRLPVQLSDVSDDVTSLFEAIEDGLAPLQSLLPPDDSSSGARSGGTAPATPQPSPGVPQQEEESREDAPAGPSSSEERQPEPESSGPSPSPEPSAEGGLLGGATGGLLEQDREATGEDEESAEDTPASPEPDVTIPPLIDGLLPGLGLDIRRAE